MDEDMSPQIPHKRLKDELRGKLDELQPVEEFCITG